MEPEHELEKRKELTKTAISWMEARRQGVLFSAMPNLIPKDNMFSDEGYLYPTKCYPVAKVAGVHRSRNSLVFRPLIYDIDYALYAYNDLIIRDLELGNQLTLLKLINDSYGDLLATTPVTFETEFNKLEDGEKLNLLKKLANQLGKRVINK